MKIFLSWSGIKSKQIAQELNNWIASVVPNVQLYISYLDISSGCRWGQSIATALEEYSFGILCLTHENFRAPWILFEAGALSKHVKKSSVVPLLFGCEKKTLEGPLNEFQSVSFNKDEFSKLVLEIAHLSDCSLRDFQIANKVSENWGDLCDVIDDILQKTSEGSISSYGRNSREYIPDVSQVCGADEKQILKCIERSRFDQDARKNIGLRALQAYFDKNENYDDSYPEFVFNAIIKKTAIDEPFVREFHVDRIVIDAPNAVHQPHWYDMKYVTFRRHSSVQLCKMGNVKAHPLRTSIESAVDIDKLEDTLHAIEYNIIFAGEPVFIWKTELRNISIKNLKEHGEADGEKCSVTVRGGRLQITVKNDVPVTREVSLLVVEESSVIRYDENFYYSTIRHPTRVMTDNAKLGPALRDWRMGNPCFAPNVYYPDAYYAKEPSHPVRVKMTEREADIHASSWVLPGIVLVLQWTYPMDITSTFP